MHLVRPWWSVACLVMVLGCGSDNPEANPTAHSIEIRPGGPLTMRQGDTSGFNVIVRDRTGAVIGHGPLSCSTSARNVATSVANTLYDSCQLAAVGAGTAIIQAEVEGVVGQMTVKVLTWPRGEVSGGAHGVAVRGSVALVTTLDNHVDRIDPASGAVQAQYDFTSPYVALSADASHAFFGNVVFDLASGTQTGVLVNDISSCGEIGAAVERPQGSANYVGCSVGVVIASSSTADILATLPTSAVSSFALDPTGDHLYATSFSAGRVYEISTATNTLARELPIPGGPQASVAPGDNELYEAMESQRQIERWDLRAGAPADSVPILKPLGFYAGPFDLALSADGTRLLTSAGPYVVEVDRADFTVSQTYWVGGNSRRIAVSGGTALVANEGGWVDVLPF